MLLYIVFSLVVKLIRFLIRDVLSLALPLLLITVRLIGFSKGVIVRISSVIIVLTTLYITI